MNNIEEFSVIMNEWLSLDTEINEYKKTIKEKKQRQSKLSEYIILFMNSNNKQVCNIDNQGSIIIKTRKTTSSLKKQDFLDFLKTILNEEQANEKIEELYSTRKTTEKSYIKLDQIT